MSNQNSSSGGFKSLFASLAIVVAFAIGVLVYRGSFRRCQQF
jgi:hypothetical protein